MNCYRHSSNIETLKSFNFNSIETMMKEISISSQPINMIRSLRNMILVRSKEYHHGVIESYGKRIQRLISKYWDAYRILYFLIIDLYLPSLKYM